MAASGFFLGGAAEGIESSRKSALEESRLQADVGLRTRGLDLQERQVDRAEQNDVITRADKQVADTMAIVAETIKQGLAVGRTPEQIKAAVAPLVQSAGQIKARIGGDPAALTAQVDAMLTGPTGDTIATAAGRAEGLREGTKQVTAAKTITGQTGNGADFIVDPTQRTAAETSLRKEFLDQSKDFIQTRDAISRMRGIEPTPAGDIGLVFSYMKILDPGGRVTEGEQATVQNAAGVPERIRGLYNSLITGEGQLSPKIRDQIRAEGEQAYQRNAINHDKRTTQYAGVAKRKGLNPNNVIMDLLPLESFKKVEDVQAALKANKIKIGDKIIFNGQVVTVNP